MNNKDEGAQQYEAPKPNSRDEVVGRFLQYKPDAEALEISADLREEYASLAGLLWRAIPGNDPRLKALALTHLEESMMFANKAVFRALQDPSSPIL